MIQVHQSGDFVWTVADLSEPSREHGTVTLNVHKDGDIDLEIWDDKMTSWFRLKEPGLEKILETLSLTLPLAAARGVVLPNEREITEAVEKSKEMIRAHLSKEAAK